MPAILRAYLADERMNFRGFASTNLERLIFITQLPVIQMLAQNTGGSVTTITAALATNPIAGIPASIPMMTKGGLDAVTISLATKHAKKNIRFNAVAPGVVDPPMHNGEPKEFLKRAPVNIRAGPHSIGSESEEVGPAWPLTMNAHFDAAYVFCVLILLDYGLSRANCC